MIKDWREGALPGEGFEEKGRDIEEGKEAAKLLVSYGYDALDVDVGTYDSWWWNHPPMRDKEGKPYIDGIKLLQSKTMWGIIAVAGCFTICGAAIASDDLGIKAAISTGLGPILNNASWPVLVILCVVVSTVFTNFTNGMPVSFTINAICIPLACTLQMNHGSKIPRLVVGVEGEALQSRPAIHHTDVQLRAEFYGLSRLAPHNGA